VSLGGRTERFAFAKCDENGNFTLPGIPYGNYKITVLTSGRHVGWRTVDAPFVGWCQPQWHQQHDQHELQWQSGELQLEISVHAVADESFTRARYLTSDRHGVDRGYGDGVSNGRSGNPIGLVMLVHPHPLRRRTMVFNNRILNGLDGCNGSFRS